jgi:hypothetical protein
MPTSFPFLKIARDSDVPYSKVLHIAEVIEGRAIPSGPTASDRLVLLIGEAVLNESKRRLDVQAEANQAQQDAAPKVYRYRCGSCGADFDEMCQEPKPKKMHLLRRATRLRL